MKRQPAGFYKDKGKTKPRYAKKKKLSVATKKKPANVVVYHPSWTPPENLVKEIKKEHQQNPDRKTASDTEALCYVSTASMAGPLNQQYFRIYSHLFYKYCLSKNIKPPDSVSQYKDLSEYDERELHRLKEWIHKQQMKEGKLRAKAKKAKTV